MSSAAGPGLRVVTFGDLEGRVWGAAFDAGRPTVLAGTGGGQPAAGPATITVSDDGGWQVAADWLALSVTAPLVSNGSSELCRVHGRVTFGDDELDVDCPATRSYAGDLDPRRLESIRGVWGWFEDGQAMALLAVRPQGRAAQEAERLTASLFDPEGPVRIEEPRLSTSYDSEGRPTRAGLELWIGEGEEQYPRRAAAEAAGPGVSFDADGLGLQVRPLRCHSHGLDGPGVYLLARF
jgi:hypothetical protein